MQIVCVLPQICRAFAIVCANGNYLWLVKAGLYFPGRKGMEREKLVIFDLDGTLFRTETVDISAFNRALAANGLEARSDAEILYYIGFTMHEVCGLIGGMDSGFECKFINDVIELEKEEIKNNGMMYDGAVELIKKLKRDGFTLCICSNGRSEYVHCILEKFSLLDMFDEIWPQKDGYDKSSAVALLMEKFGFESFIMVGDRASDIEAARVNGGISIGMIHGFGGDEALAADYTAGSIHELEELIYKFI